MAVKPKKTRFENSKTAAFIRKHGNVRWIFAAVALLGLISLAPCCNSRVMLDLRTEQVTFTVGDDSTNDDREVELGIGFPLDSLTVSGFDRIRYREADFSAANSQGEATALHLGSQDHSAGAHPGALRAIVVRSGALVTMSFDGRYFSVIVDAGGGQVEMEIDAAAGWRIPTAQIDESGNSSLGPAESAPVLVTLASHGTLQLTGEIALEERGHALKMGIQRGLPASRVRVSDAGRGSLPSMSSLLAGTIRFVDLKEREEKLWPAERISTEHDSGQLLLVECVSDGAKIEDAKRAEHGESSSTNVEEPHLHVVWLGEVSGAEVGQPGAMRSVMPSLLTNRLGARGSGEYLAIMTSVLAFMALLFHHGEKHALHLKEAEHERSEE